jgi:hypothetical protein
VVTVLVAVFLLAHASVLVTGDQHWPVMSFPMLSFNFEHDLTCTAVFAIPADETKPEFRLMPQQVGIHGTILSYVFGKILKYPDRNPEFDKLAAECPTEDTAQRTCVGDRLARNGLEFVYARYELQRQHSPQLPPLRGLRLYDMRFATSPRIYDEVSRQLRVEWLSGAGAESR